MNKRSYKMLLMVFMTIFMFACDDDGDASQPGYILGSNTPDGNDNTPDGDTPTSTPTLQAQAVVADADAPLSKSGEQILGNANYPAISYGAWRTTTRAAGALVPTVEQQKEDMKILAAMGIKVIRTYNTQGYIGDDGKSNTENLLEAIKQLMAEDESFEMYVMLGVWIDALNSWTDIEVIHDQENPGNALEMAAGIELAKAYPEIIKVIAVGNEAMVHWAPYHVAPAIILGHVNALQALKASGDIDSSIWITSSDNHASWSGQGDYANDDLAALVKAVDYISLHTYPFHDTHYDPSFWATPYADKDKSTQDKADDAMLRARDVAIAQYKAGQDYMLSLGINKPIHVGETGWSSETNLMYGEAGTGAADEYKEKAFYDLIRTWSNSKGISVFFFEAFDEPWKGSPDNSGDSEKHFGLINIDCEVKYVLWDLVDANAFDGLTRDCGVDGFTKTEGGNEQAIIDSILEIPVSAEPVDAVAGEFAVLGTALYDGATAFGWEGTAWAGVNTDTSVLTVATDPASPKDWGWGASVGVDGQFKDLTNSTKITFEIKGVTSAESVFPAFAFSLGYQSKLGGEWGTNTFVRFNTPGYMLTEEWVKYTLDISEFTNYNLDYLTQVNSPFAIFDQQGSAITVSSIEVRNISWLE